MRWVSLLGLVVMMLLAWLISENRRKMQWRLIVTGVLLQILLAYIILRSGIGDVLFGWANTFVFKILEFSDAGAAFVFGEETFRHHFFAFSVLPTIIFVSTLTAVLFHFGILQFIVGIMAKVMVWAMDVSGSESLAASANVFVGQTEAPLLVRPYMETMTRSELMAMMTGGMATIAGGVMAAYASMGANPGHLLTASLISAPASLVLAKIILPESETSPTKGLVKVDIDKPGVNVLDAACHGASDGLKLALNVGAMLIAFVALVALANWILTPTQYIPGLDGPLTLESILGFVCAPLAWLMGIEWKDATAIGTLLGVKTIANEFIAYDMLVKMKDSVSPRSFTIATYALCGFANFGSIAIQIGGLGGLVPHRRKDFAALSFKAMIGGTLAAFMTACIAGFFI